MRTVIASQAQRISPVSDCIGLVIVEIEFVSLAIIAIISAIVPLAANRIPNKIVPETVLLLIAGVVTNVAVSAGAMEQSTASIMVAAGAVSVFLMPLLASACQRIVKD